MHLELPIRKFEYKIQTWHYVFVATEMNWHIVKYILFVETGKFHRSDKDQTLITMGENLL